MSHIPPLIYADPRFRDHQTGGHPENSFRLNAIEELLSTELTTWEPHSVGIDASIAKQLVAQVHDPSYIQKMEQFANHGGGYWDADTFVSPESMEIALLASQTAVSALEQIMKRPKCPRAMILSRPPGHHAVADTAMGFCLFNHIAVLARQSINHFEMKNVLIIDWDVHHGNGTQDLFYDDGQVFYFSVHRDPFYPGTGLREETGTKAGLKATCNLPLSYGISRHDYRSSVTAELSQFADRCQPDLVLISAGFDAHHRDPIGSLGLETEDYTWLTDLACQIAETHCAGRIISILEGGYHPEALAESVLVHIQHLVTE